MPYGAKEIKKKKNLIAVSWNPISSVAYSMYCTVQQMEKVMLEVIIMCK